MTLPISGLGYPNYGAMTAIPSANGQPWLNQQYMQDFGFAQNPVYDLNVAGNFGGYGMGMGMGMMPRYSNAYLKYINMDYKDRLGYDHEYNQAAREFNFQEGRSAKQYAALADGETGNIAMTCRSLNAAIVDGDTDQVVREFNRIVNCLKTSPIYDKLKKDGSYSEEQIDWQLRETAFRQFQAATGQDLTQIIDQSCDSSIANGFFSTLSFGNSQHYSKEEMISKLYGKATPHTTAVKKAAGKAAGVMTYAATGALIGCAIPVVGPIAGGAIGAVAGIIGACC